MRAAEPPSTPGNFAPHGPRQRNLWAGAAQKTSATCLGDIQGIPTQQHSECVEPTDPDGPGKRIDAAFPDATLIASVHRMGLLRHFDRMVLMAAGRIIDSGTVGELLERQPLFRERHGARPAGQDAAGSSAAA